VAIMILNFNSRYQTVDDPIGLATWTRKSQVTCRMLLRAGEAMPKSIARE